MCKDLPVIFAHPNDIVHQRSAHSTALAAEGSKNGCLLKIYSPPKIASKQLAENQSVDVARCHLLPFPEKVS